MIFYRWIDGYYYEDNPGVWDWQKDLRTMGDKEYIETLPTFKNLIDGSDNLNIILNTCIKFERYELAQYIINKT